MNASTFVHVKLYELSAWFLGYYPDIEKTYNHLLISLDCQKNQSVPKVPDSAEYYSRQIYAYNFIAVKEHAKVPVDRNNVKRFVWTEK